jgi:hypothetical protein
MRKTISALGIFFIAVGMAVASSADVASPRIQGKYLEVRTADVWTGPCFANGEVNLVGKEGLMAWQVERGGWNGVALDGLKVVAVLRSNATLGDPYARSEKARAVILVDSSATNKQSEALVSFAKSMAGRLLNDVVAVRSMPIEMKVAGESGVASLQAGDQAELRTRPLNHHDMYCGNEIVYYPPLTSVSQAKPAYTLAYRFDGKGLGATWSCPAKRSAFVGTFAR